jgi:hypothetical protein
LPERSERTICGLDPAKSAAKPARDREDGRIVPSDSLQQHLVAAKFASGTGFLPPETGAQESSIPAPSRLAITYRAVKDLIPDPRNARTHSKRQVDQIRESIEAFGFTNPILADPEGRLIAGHGRLQAARTMGLSRPSPCPGSRRSRSERCGSPTTRSLSMPAGSWKSCSWNWANSLRSTSISIPR